MKVFKFGGASIKSAEAVKNMASIVKHFCSGQLLVVVSAMGKTTNKLEEILHGDNSDKTKITNLHNEHLEICEGLFTNTVNIKNTLKELFDELRIELAKPYDYNERYDQIISFGELFSSTIISEYLNSIDLQTALIDSRKIIRTNKNYRNATVDWITTENNIQAIKGKLNDHVILTQGFLGGTEEGKTTTLGREGSDFSAAIYAYCLNAESLTVWKDVPGILNADPKLINDVKLFSEIPYKEVAEMTYYGASVIHPKTIKPLANKNIPLLVKSFDNPEAAGTIIKECAFKKPMSSIIIKENQCLISFHVIDYTFINEDNLSLIFKVLASLDIKINIMQNSAISFSIVIDYDEAKVYEMIRVLSGDFDIKYNTKLTLITIKNYKKGDIKNYRKGKKMLLEQTSRNNYRALYSA